MLDKEKVKLMTELAFYEQNEGKEDFKINEYYRKDYAGYHTLCSVLWVTLGYIAAVGLVAVASLDYIVDSMSKSMMIKMGIFACIGYLIILIVYTLVANIIYDRKHKQARKRMRKFNHNLIKLLKMYDKEKQ